MSRPTPQTCQFVLASDLFRGYETLYKKFAEHSGFTWVDAGRTLVEFYAILNDMDNHDVEYSDEFVNRVPLYMYVDLEN